MKDTERRFILLQLWFLREPERRHSNGVLASYGWLEQNRPELVKSGHGDPYKQLLVDLQDHILDPV